MDQAQLRQHVTILGWLHIAAAGLAILVGAFLFLLFGGIGLAQHDRDAQTFLPLIGFIAAVFLFLVSVPGLLAGYGLLQRRRWGRILAIVVGALHLASVPVGTALGIYTFIILANPQAEAFFRPAA
jgi:uncharacterized membrane protein